MDEQIKVPRFREEEGYYTTEKRSRIMSKIRAKNTKPEVMLRKALYASGFRYRIYARDLPGKPDIVNRSKKVAIFVDGEFWHGKDWENKKNKIKSNKSFWHAKIERNIQRDQENNKALETLGFTVIRFWSGEVSNDINKCVMRVFDFIHSGKKDK